jgi:carnosine N-methyltransferase
MFGDEEKEHWWQVSRTLLHYHDFFQAELERRQRHLNRLPTQYVARLPEKTFSKLRDLDIASAKNQEILDDMVDFHAREVGLEPPQSILSQYQQADGSVPEGTIIVPERNIGGPVHIAQQHRNQAVIHSIYREWSAAAQKERDESFGVLIASLQKHLPVEEGKAYEKRVCVPGCGLGRLPLEIAACGYSCEGNEFSAYMAIASNFMLNALVRPEVYTIYPWVGNICNIVNVKDSLESYSVPDRTAFNLLSDATSPYGYPRFSMAAGSFTEIYTGEENVDQWDGVVTCFFIDTAPVVLDYLETIYQMLKPGGVWVNLGPLLYHWVADVDANEDDRYDQSVEVCIFTGSLIVRFLYNVMFFFF